MRISRDEMRAIFARKESVIIDGIIYTSEADLPSEAALALGDEAQEAAARVSLEAKMEALKAEMAILDAPKPVSVVVEEPKKVEAEVEVPEEVEEVKEEKTKVDKA